MALTDQINQNFGFFCLYPRFLFIKCIIGSPKANNTFLIIPGQSLKLFGVKLLEIFINKIEYNSCCFADKY